MAARAGAARHRRGARAAGPLAGRAPLLGGAAHGRAPGAAAGGARLDLDQGRLQHAAIQLAAAFASALPELRAEENPDLSVRIAELEELSAGVLAQQRAARDEQAPDGAQAQAPSEEVVRHALERLEAALRARTAGGLR